MQFHEEEDMERPQLDRLDGEQVAGDDRGNLRRKEPPGIALRSQSAPLDREDAAYGARRDIESSFKSWIRR